MIALTLKKWLLIMVQNIKSAIKSKNHLTGAILPGCKLKIDPFFARNRNPDFNQC